jgi:hypothetical protein
VHERVQRGAGGEGLHERLAVVDPVPNLPEPLGGQIEERASFELPRVDAIGDALQGTRRARSAPARRSAYALASATEGASTAMTMSSSAPNSREYSTYRSIARCEVASVSVVRA